MNDRREPVADILDRIHRASTDSRNPTTTGARLLAVSKTRGADEIRALALQGQRAFGENYVQEAIAKQAGLRDLPLEWHLIGHLQSNKAREAARAFDWMQSVDRPRIVAALARHRPPESPPLNVLIQLNIDDEASKEGCQPDEIPSLADAIADQPRLRLRGLMTIPAPLPDMELRRASFRRAKILFDTLRDRHPGVDTLSMGMSEDFELAIAEGSTMVRIGTALFGPRPKPDDPR
jgi:pyridoxal phosphate enzyme (YggS family)